MQIREALAGLQKEYDKASGSKKGAVKKHISKILDALLSGTELEGDDAELVAGVDMKNLEKAREVGLPVITVGVAGMADPVLESVSDQFTWLRRMSLGAIFRAFRRGNARQWTMAGKFHKHVLYHPWRWFQFLPDWRMVRFYFFRKFVFTTHRSATPAPDTAPQR